MLSPQQQVFLPLGAKTAVAAEKDTALPAEVTLGQMILESSWGKDAPGNNYFGIKFNGRGNGKQVLPTHEWIGGKYVLTTGEFNTYPSAQASCDDHAWLITKGYPYAQIWAQYQKDRNLPAFVMALGPIYGGRENRTYGPILMSIINSAAVKEALSIARQPQPVAIS